MRESNTPTVITDAGARRAARRPDLRQHRRFVLLVVLLGGAPAVARAQAGVGRPAIVVQVEVVDTAARPIAGAEVLIVRERRTIAAGRTDSAGAAALTLAAADTDHELVARKIGFRRASRFVRLPDADTLAVTITLGPAVQQLEGVRITGRESGTRRGLRVDAGMIAGSRRLVRSALDAVLGLEPDMLVGRGGWHICETTLQEVWINGERMSKQLVPDPRWVGRQLPGVPPRAPPVPPEVLTLLSRVRAEHIAEMTYFDCLGGPVGKIGSENAVFIVLQHGVEFRWPYGTFVAADSTGGPPGDRP